MAKKSKMFTTERIMLITLGIILAVFALVALLRGCEHGNKGDATVEPSAAAVDSINMVADSLAADSLGNPKPEGGTKASRKKSEKKKKEKAPLRNRRHRDEIVPASDNSE